MKNIVLSTILIFIGLQSFSQNGLTLTADGGMLLNTDQQIGSSDVVLKSTNDSSFGGMYIDSPSSTLGRPFYGYSLNGVAKSYHWFDAADSRWKLYTGGSGNALEIGADKKFYLNTAQQLTSDTDLTLRSSNSGFGGMFIDSPDASSGKPFYGYGIDGTDKAFHYYDNSDGRWKLFTNDSELQNALEVSADNRVMINTSQNFNSFTNLTLRADQNSFGGMYIDSGDATTGKPFYGYAVDGTDKAFHYYDQEDSRWKLFAGSTSASNNAMEIDEFNRIMMNTDQNFNFYTNLTLGIDQNGFGGMYIVSDDNSNGKPFYGYAVGGIDRAFHYYDETDETWKLFTGNSSFDSAIEVGSDNLVHMGGKIQLGIDDDLSTDPNGTIVFTGNGFWGKRGGNWYRLDANLPSTPFRTTELEQENEDLRQKVDELENRIARLEQLLD